MIQRLFLRAQHWQLFMLFAGLPILAMIVINFLAFSEIKVAPNDPVDNFQSVGKIMESFKLIFYVAFIAIAFTIVWIWSISIGMKDKIDISIQPNYIPLHIACTLIILITWLIFERFADLFSLPSLNPSPAEIAAKLSTFSSLFFS